MNNDMKFFTNEPERNLYDRFNKILMNNTKFFDVLVGYFRASGFYLLQDALDNVEHTRILIGINTDKEIFEMYKESQQQITEISSGAYESKKQYKEELKKEFDCSDDTEEVENGVNKFIRMIRDGKLELRIYTKQPIHAKVYVMLKDQNKSDDYGKVITGSSNFSYNGLVNNMEFNVELKDYEDVKFAEDKFNELWNDSVDISYECIDTIEKDTWIKQDITPYEMYLKFLYEYFKEQINDDINLDFNDGYFADGFKPYQYQKDAVIQAKRILEQHNGVFLSDVVGLGKTYMASLLAVELIGKKMFIVPPVLMDYWRSVLTSFGVRGFIVKSSGSLNKICQNKEYKDYKYIFVDEAHKFRNEKTQTYADLHEICANKKVVLITATPQNNYITDIANQMYLFESKTNSTIPGVKKLEQFFAGLNSEVSKYEKDKSSPQYHKALDQASDKIRDRVLRQVMIRRTRTEIQNNYGSDMRAQGLSFPKVNDPSKEVYVFDNDTEIIFEKTIEDIKKLTYARYKPLTYVKESELSPEQRTLLIGQQNMGGFMKGVLVKRLESSKYAFEQSLNRFILSLTNFIKMYNSGVVWISKKLDINQLVIQEEFDFDSLEDQLGEIHFKSEDFNEKFIKDLSNDLAILTALQSMWISLKKDNKLDYFIKLLQRDDKLKNKIIIFTESRETADYLTNNIQSKLQRKVIEFTGSMSDSIKNKIKNNFDPTVDEEVKEDNYDVLVTTDVLAEGMNLHRSNVVINYDLPWNPTRIMQRVGRINRVGTKHKELYIYNFFPTDSSNDLIHQEENIISKIKMFHDLLGEDSKYLTDEEEVTPHELFKQMTTIDDDGETGLNVELKYLSIIREIRDKNPNLFNKIKKLPKKIKIGRCGENDELLTFFRKGYVKKFYVSSNNNTIEKTFDDAIKIVETDKNEKSVYIKDNYYQLLKINKDAFRFFEEEDGQNEFSTVESRKGTSNAKVLIQVIKEITKMSELSEEELEKANKLVELLKDGAIPIIVLKEANKTLKINMVGKGPRELLAFYRDFVSSIPDTYFDYTDSNINNNSEPKEIVLSELFMK